jgi:hypothetical protein
MSKSDASAAAEEDGEAEAASGSQRSQRSETKPETNTDGRDLAGEKLKGKQVHAKAGYLNKEHATREEMVTQFSESKTRRGFICEFVVGHAGKPKLLTYDLEKLVKWGGIATMFSTGTIFNGCGAFQVAISSYFVAGLAFAGFASLETMDSQGVEELARYMNAFVPFVLGLYISLTLTRWWALRVNALGALLEAVANVMLIIASLLRHPRFMPLLDQVFRYSMASVLLVVKAARDQDNIDDITVKKKILTQEELDVCKPLPMEHRPMIPWVIHTSVSVCSAVYSGCGWIVSS